MRVLLIALLLSTTAAFAQLGAPMAPASDLQRTWTWVARSMAPPSPDISRGSRAANPSRWIWIRIWAWPETDHPRLSSLTTRDPVSPSRSPTALRNTGVIGTVMRTITVNGESYSAGTEVQSHVKLASVDGIWTIKFVGGSDAWMGLDLGAQVWTIDMDAADASRRPPRR